MKGYKAFNNDLTCRDFQYEIGKEYVHKGEIEPCRSGFHFCKSIADCYNFYSMNERTRICEVEATGNIKKDDSGIKFCTDRIKIIREIVSDDRRGNASVNNSGYCNSGDWNSGNRNSGNRNSGYCNSGDWNSGNRNSGNRNSGDCNSGDWNSGDWNSGDWNSGNRNSGDRNSGDWNSGDCNSGIFCTETPKLRIFDKESDWSYNDWIFSFARSFMSGCPHSHSFFVCASDMTDEEKDKHPEHKVIGGYIKTIVVTAEDKQKWWNERPIEDREKVINELPNFDAEKFYKCTGIKVKGA